jgi:nucleoside-diphosphate-sugar epimerase
MVRDISAMFRKKDGCPGARIVFSVCEPATTLGRLIKLSRARPALGLEARNSLEPGLEKTIARYRARRKGVPAPRIA